MYRILGIGRKFGDHFAHFFGGPKSDDLNAFKKILQFQNALSDDNHNNNDADDDGKFPDGRREGISKPQ